MSTPSTFYFVSSNQFKFEEYLRIFKLHGITIDPVLIDISEVQSVDPVEIATDKLLKAYAILRRPVIVEHSSLSLSALGGLPMGLTKPFWLILKDHICQIASSLGDTKAEMIVCMAFCDGRQTHVVCEKVSGNIAASPLPGLFHLDRVFIPNGAKKALAGMTGRGRDKWSPRAKAAASLISTRLNSFSKEQAQLV